MQTPGIRLKCWEGYESETITQPFSNRTGATFKVESLTSDRIAADEFLNGAYKNWDVININNAYIKNCLEPAGLISKLSRSRFSHYEGDIHESYASFLPWSYSSSGELIGIGQRFGPFNFVVNTKKIDRESARDQGFQLANDPDFTNRFGILDYPDFNAFHFCLGADIDPFAPLDRGSLEKLELLAMDWYTRARLVTVDHHTLNQSMVNGDIDFYISGGVYTVSPARLSGQHHLAAATPRIGPMQGKGGIVFTEITSLLKHANASNLSEDFLLYLLEPAVAAKIAFVGGTCNPVAQMGNPEVFSSFSKTQLDAIQWDWLEEDLTSCQHYQIPPNNSEILAILSQARQMAGWD